MYRTMKKLCRNRRSFQLIIPMEISRQLGFAGKQWVMVEMEDDQCFRVSKVNVETTKEARIKTREEG